MDRWNFVLDGGSSTSLCPGHLSMREMVVGSQKTRFRDVKYARIWDTERVDDHSDKNTIDDTKHKINTKHNTKPNNVCSDLKTLGDT